MGLDFIYILSTWPISQRTYHYTAKDHTFLAIRIWNSLTLHLTHIMGTSKNLRMPACCYQLKFARKAETLSLWQEHRDMFLLTGVLCYHCLLFFGQLTAENIETRITENDPIHFPHKKTIQRTRFVIKVRPSFLKHS